MANRSSRSPSGFIGLCCFGALIASAAAVRSADQDKWWPDYAGGPGSARYFEANQITKSNVDRLGIAWTYPYGETGSNPIVVGGVVYGRGRNGSLLAIDAKRGIGYFPIGSPTYDYYGADRPGANLFGSSLVALDARTGKRRWHFQMVHHDLWDFDGNAAPQLTTIKRNGKSIDVVALAGKTGFLYVFDRETGAPIWPIEERPVPKSEMPGEQSWPTQPFPTAPPPFSKQAFTADDIKSQSCRATVALWKAELPG